VICTNHDPFFFFFLVDINLNHNIILYFCINVENEKCFFFFFFEDFLCVNFVLVINVFLALLIT
jgi:hypothetical protein